MASIQQSMNQLLGALAGATTAGTYMYRQSDTHKIKTLEKRQTKLEDASNELGTMAIEELENELGKSVLKLTNKDIEEGFYETPSGKASKGVNIELANTARELLHLQPSQARAENYSQYYGNILEQDRAEQSALQRQENAIKRIREQKEALAIRTSILRGTPAEHLLYPKEDNK